ncbi:MAG: hypothetical protein A3A98_01095 [Candidatus Staskawiczbacteria bacterium RIFCSPLOWO2_01_FULL_40_39]|uniref:Radical SAM core domain-containing protein n=1 Tax=Candidatus Staskawiczbacteria bacterium RIFCSPHIGHO2_01_FULL_39_25 TaxID=1802202 RepID=A0A1G2HMY3_9BACT|nr:MAG: hypothetical protein A2730_01095 [Candidatus Staskawiczbacteria bacterium RIFCSPHIGHO2_01_FULL_39_25]OGZ73325.1 MAG: hypothetical protein A3A98_01095 [Candidatus Staskawiczbacteria bacterium RIFCSPLOWO2_01_FULL_40_39]OGZ75447.1 MAG: hypothetical protein A3I87_01610 [Candidatus Staskawiczbacteria bacterium RIFCSPLOWO2_02_FULL_39_8]
MELPQVSRKYVTSRQELGDKRAQALAEIFEQYEKLPALAARIGFVSLYVTGRCHLQCPHCYAEEEFQGLTRDASTEQMAKIINSLAILTDRIQLTGGEIFVRADPESHRNDVLLLVDEISRRNRETIVQTTGMHVTNSMLAFCANRNVKWFSLSLDGPDAKSNSEIRGDDAAFTKTIALIPELKKYGFKVKVGTTITSVTSDINKIVQLGHMMVDLGVDNWKLTQFFGREVGRTSGLNADRMSVSDDTYRTIVEEALRLFRDKIRVTIHSLADFYASPALLVQPTGVVTVTQGTKDVFMSNILTDQPKAIINRLQSVNGLFTITANAQKTY